MMTLERAADILRGQKFRATKPKDKKMLPKYMLGWSEERIDNYYKEQEEVCQALELAINTLSIVRNFKNASYELVDIFDRLDK